MTLLVGREQLGSCAGAQLMDSLAHHWLMDRWTPGDLVQQV